MDLALNNLQRLICHKTQQTKPSYFKPYDCVQTNDYNPNEMIIWKHNNI